jgi:hypothetical protein
MGFVIAGFAEISMIARGSNSLVYWRSPSRLVLKYN